MNTSDAKLAALDTLETKQLAYLYCIPFSLFCLSRKTKLFVFLSLQVNLVRIHNNNSLLLRKSYKIFSIYCDSHTRHCR